MVGSGSFSLIIRNFPFFVKGGDQGKLRNFQISAFLDLRQFRERAQSSLLLFRSPESQNQFSSASAVSVLAEINSLPDSEKRPSVSYWNLNARAHE